MLLWAEFFICAAVIVFSGSRLSRYGDVIAEKTGLGRAWIGLLLMAGVTSLPELITGVSSVTLARSPNIALGDIMGSCVFNLSIIAILDIFHGRRPIFSKAEHGHILAAGIGIILIGFVSLTILVHESIPPLGFVGMTTPVLVAMYLLGIRGLFFFEKRRMAERRAGGAEPELYRSITIRGAVARYALHALIIVAAAVWLPFIGNGLAEQTGLGRSFIGTVFIALATSLPELVVSISALRLGATDMAIANLFGSNLFNIFIVAVDDLCYLPGPLLAAVSTNHVISGITAMLMTAIAIVSLTYRVERKAFLRLGWDTAALLLAFLVNISLLYALRAEP